jgi:hypothetical protein
MKGVEGLSLATPNRSASIIDIGQARTKQTGVEVVEQPDVTITVEDNGSITVDVPGNADQIEEVGPDDNFDRNLAEGMDQGALDAIAMWLLDGIEADRESRRDWEDTANVAAKYLGVKLEDPTTSVSADGTVCKAIATCMLETAMKLWSTGRAELLPVGGPVKVRNDQPAIDQHDPSGIAAKPPAPAQQGVAAAPPTPPQPTIDELGESLESDMNHYLTVRDKEYYPDFSKMLMNRALVGMAFRKVYRCPLKRRPVSVWVRAQDLIVSNDCSHLQGAGRITEVIRVRRSTMRRLQVAGAYLDIPLVQPTGEVTPTELAIADQEGIAPVPQLPADYEHLVYECRSEIGSDMFPHVESDLVRLDRDETGKRPGYPLPYRVTMDKDSRMVLEIRRNWKKGDPDHNPKRSYVKYGLIPGLGFYDWGLIHIVGNPTQAATMIQRAAVDSTLFANFPGGIFMKGPASRQSNTVVRPNPGEFVGVDGAGAGSIKDVFMPMPYKDVSGTALQLEQKLEGDVRRLGGIIEIPVGEGRIGNTPVGTIMSYIEAVSQVPGAVHKDDHIAQQEEYEMLRELFAEEPDTLISGNRSPARQQWTAEELLQPDLVPAADPNTPSQVHRLMKGQGMIALGGMPQFQGIANNRAIFQFVMRLLAGGDAEEFTLPEQAPQPAPPPPQVIAAQIRSQAQETSDQAKVQVATTAAQAKEVQAQSEAEQRDLDRQSEETRAAMSLKGKQLDTLHDSANQALDRAQADRHKQMDQSTPDDQGSGLDTNGPSPTQFAGPF